MEGYDTYVIMRGHDKDGIYTWHYTGIMEDHDTEGIMKGHDTHEITHES